jgi:hypothetical protein
MKAKDAWRKCEPMKLLAMIFIEFNAMVVRYGIDPQEAHKAFLAIDEYRDAIAPDRGWWVYLNSASDWWNTRTHSDAVRRGQVLLQRASSSSRSSVPCGTTM